MWNENTLVTGVVRDLGAFDGGGRLQATLLPDDDRPAIRVDVGKDEEALISAITLGARISCRTEWRTTPKGPIRIAHRIELVERREEKRRWVKVWENTTPYEERPFTDDAPAPVEYEAQRKGETLIRRRRKK